MFKFNEYRITFKHVPQDRDTIKRLNATGHVHSPFAEKTVCSIFIDSEGKDASPVAVGVAMCSLKDQFDRTKGRELAFARAIQQLKNKADRKEFWLAFWKSADGRHTDGAAVAFLNGEIEFKDYAGGPL